MQAYATAERPDPGERLPLLHLTSHRSVPTEPTLGDSGSAAIDQLLVRLANLVVDRMIERTSTGIDDQVSEWMDARGAAAYLGIHRDTLRKLAAQRSIPTHQNGPRCKLYFRRDELDDWRSSARSRLRALS